MKKNKLVFASSFALIISSGAMVQAEVASQPWQARSVEDVLAGIETTDDNQVKYTIQYGDTLDVISEAMKIEAETLAEINDIYNIDLIYPETVLYASYDNQARAHSVTVETTEGVQYETPLAVNLSLTPATWLEEDNQVVASVASLEAEQDVPQVAENQAQIEKVQEELIAKEEDQVSSSVYTFKYVEAKATEKVVNLPQEGVEKTEEIIEEKEIVVDEAEDVLENVVENKIVETAPSLEVAEALKEKIPVENIEAEVEVGTPPKEIVEDAFQEAAPEIYRHKSVEVETETPESEYTEPEHTEAQVQDPMANPQNRGLQAHVAEFKEKVAAQHGIKDFSLYRPGDPGDHGKGLAVDFMVYGDEAKGDAIAEYSIQQMENGQEDISYVIWKQQIYGDWNLIWEPMEDRGSITANHYDHVHVSFHKN